MKKIRFIALLLVLLSLLMVIPTTFAFDNDTIVSSDANSVILSDDYYFDANLSSDTGDGSISNPYKELTSDRIQDNSVIHMLNGEYSLDYSKTVRNVTIIGQDAQNTIIRSNGLTLTVSTSFTLQNVTLMNLRINSDCDFNAANVIFRDSSSTNGGAVSALSSSNLYFDNATFINDTASNGGAIYQMSGNLTIINSRFIDCNATLNGGAIYAQNNNLEINGTDFSNNHAIGEAGGSIYLFDSCFNSYSLSISDCQAQFGGAIAVLKTDVNLNNFTARGNKAKYRGGAVYSIYNSFSINGSIIESNQALNGGGLFINLAYGFYSYNNDFTNNDLGAVYVISEDIESENNTFLNNEEYLRDIPSLSIGDGNYSLLKSDFNDISDIPSRYDLRDLGQVSSVKAQGSGGNCWSFAALSALESSILKATGIEHDLSEENMKNIMAKYSEYGWDMETNVGGYQKMAVGYLTSWLGPVNDSSDIYNYNSLLSPILPGLFHIQNVLYLYRDNYTDNDAIKMAIMKYGGVATSIYAAGGTYQYYTGTSSNNHAVAIVGWDDDLQFSGAPGNGGWIVKNSWGPTSQDHGFFYVSYYDVSCAKPGKTGDTYCFVLNDTAKYDKNYQYDVQGLTDYFLNTTSTVWYKNKFVSTSDEYLAAVSTHFEKDSNWELSIYVNGQLKHTQTGSAVPSYSTIDLNQLIQLHENDEFEVVFKITVDGDAGVPISEEVSLNWQFYTENISFISHDGKTWSDLCYLESTYPNHTYVSQVACIKAFTVLNPIVANIDLTVVDNVNPAVVEAVVTTEYGKIIESGEVVFATDGHAYRVNIENGVARFSYSYSTLGSKLIQAVYQATGYVTASKSVSVPVYARGDLEVHTNVTVDYTDAVINVTLSKPINEVVYVEINNVTFNVTTIDGIGILNITNFYYGNYTLKAYTLSSDYNCINATDSFEISYYDTYILVYNTDDYYGENCRFNIALIDRYYNPIANKPITFTVSGFSQATGITDENGKTFLIFRNLSGVYTVNIAFAGEGSYLKTSANVIFTVKSTITLQQYSKYSYNSNYEVYLTDSNGNPLANRTVTIGPNYENSTTDENGKITVNIDFAPNNYTMRIVNPQNGEVATQNIQVVKRITENKALTMYYGAGKSYTVRVCDDYGNFISGIGVTFKINGKTYTRYTNANGYASLKISLKPGTYTITADVKGFKVSNKIVVKTTIVTKDLTVKKGKTIKFTAKLLNSNGKILKNKKVTFKFKGKTYKVKTSSKGIATLKLKNSYKVGTYKIYTTYGSLIVKNSIKIKK